MELMLCTMSDLWKWYEGFDGRDIHSIRREVYYSFEKWNKKRKYLPKEFIKTLEYLCKEDKVNSDTLGLYNPDTDMVEPLDDKKWNKIFSSPNFTQVVLHYYDEKSNHSLLEVKEDTFYTLNGNLYNESLLHKFQGLYRTDFISKVLYENIIKSLKKDYNVDYNDMTSTNYPFIFAPVRNYGYADSQYNIHLDIRNDVIIEGTDLSGEDDTYRPNDNLRDIERLNDILFDGNKDTYKYFKNMSTRNELKLECMYIYTDYELERKVYLLEHDSDYSILDACIIDFDSYKRNINSIKKYLDDIDARFYKLSGKHILKKIKN